jgi:hypothetical protein
LWHYFPKWLYHFVLPSVMNKSHLILSLFGILAILNGCVAVFHCFHFKLANDMRHWASFICLFIICVFSLPKCLLRSLDHLFNEFLCFLIVEFQYFVYFIRYVFHKDCLPLCSLSFHSLNIIFHSTEIFNLNEVQFINSFFHELLFWCYI